MFAAMLVFAVAQAQDPPAGPARCEAILTGPVSGCALNGVFAATGTGPVERQARRRALDRLEEVVTVEMEARARRAEGTVAETLLRDNANTCGDVVRARSRVYCFSEPNLGQEALCLAELGDRACWTGGPLAAEGPAWQVMERGRDRLCDAVDAHLRGEGATADRQASCRVRCLQEARVRCPVVEDPVGRR